MKIKKSLLVQIIKKEMANHIGRLLEDGPKDHNVNDADNDLKDKESKDSSKKIKPQHATDVDVAKTKTDAPGGKPQAKDAEPPKQELEAEPVDKDIETDVTSDKPEDESTKSDISDTLTGKTVQSITMEPKSKVLPGAQEIVLTFNEIPDPLRILLTKTGRMAFYFRGLRNDL